MDNLILASAIVITLLLISAVSSPKFKALIYSFPAPATVVLLGTGGNVNITHLAGLVFVILFMTSTFILFKKYKVPIVPAIIASILLYILLGSFNKYIIDIPFMFGYALILLLWIYFIIKPIRLTKSHYKKINSGLSHRQYLARAAIIFILAYTVIGLKGLILGAAVTFPFNGIFANYVMRNHLPVFITEIMRNIIGVTNLFFIVWLLEDIIGLWSATLLGLIVCGLSIFVVAKYIPRKYGEAVV